MLCTYTRFLYRTTVCTGKCRTSGELTRLVPNTNSIIKVPRRQEALKTLEETVKHMGEKPGGDAVEKA